MNYIERIFGVAPDGGDGSLERLYLLCLFWGVALVVGALSQRASRRKRIPPPVTAGEASGVAQSRDVD